MKRKAYNAEGAVTVGPYSHGVGTGDYVFLSGQTPLDSGTGKLVEGGVATQTQRCFDNLFSVLKEAGLTSENVEKVNVYLADMNDFESMNEVYARQFKKPYPARTTIGVKALPLGASIEIEMIAKKL
jgi:2-iminobutanoate/2-iminopropanoate deaminase